MFGFVGRITFVLILGLLPSFQVLPTVAQHQATPAANAEFGWSQDVCYEIFVRSFADSNGDGQGDLNGLIGRLNYLNDGDPSTTKDLGVTCVWLMPVFRAASYHGYDTIDYYSIMLEYGTMDDFDRFITEAHQRGIQVILDLVLNHTSELHPWFQSALKDPDSPFRDWYVFAEIDPGYVGPDGQPVWYEPGGVIGAYYALFGSGMPDLNYRNPEVTKEALRISRFWLKRGVDGFRLDAIKHLIENGPDQVNTPETHQWLREYRTFLDAEFPNALTVGEIFNAGASMLDPYYPDQLHCYFQFEMAGQFLIAAQQGVGDGLEYVFEDALERQPDAPWATFLTNHDQNRSMSTLNGDVVRAKLAAFALLTMPGLPFVYYGEEIGMTGVKPDELIRSPMQWTAESGGGFSTGEPWIPLHDDAATANVAAQDDEPSSLLNYYRALIHLRTEHLALGSGSFIALDSSDRSVLAFFRVSPDEIALVVVNFGDGPIADLMLSMDESEIPGGTYDLRTVFGVAGANRLTVGVHGEVVDWSPGFEVGAQSGYVFVLTE